MGLDKNLLFSVVPWVTVRLSFFNWVYLSVARVSVATLYVPSTCFLSMLPLHYPPSGPPASTARQRWTVELRLHHLIHDAWISAAHHNVRRRRKAEADAFFVSLEQWRAESREVEFSRPCLIPYCPVAECLTSGGSRATGGSAREFRIMAQPNGPLRGRGLR